MLSFYSSVLLQQLDSARAQELYLADLAKAVGDVYVCEIAAAAIFDLDLDGDTLIAMNPLWSFNFQLDLRRDLPDGYRGIVRVEIALGIFTNSACEELHVILYSKGPIQEQLFARREKLGGGHLASTKYLDVGELNWPQVLRSASKTHNFALSALGFI